jgi:hypothetical protein
MLTPDRLAFLADQKRDMDDQPIGHYESVELAQECIKQRAMLADALILFERYHVLQFALGGVEYQAGGGSILPTAKYHDRPYARDVEAVERIRGAIPPTGVEQ